MKSSVHSLISPILAVLGLVMLMLVHTVASASAGTRPSACARQAETPLENLYCSIKDQGEGRQLPNFIDFRRNNPEAQKLLLRRPAKKLGLAIPDQKTSITSTEKAAQQRTTQGQSNPETVVISLAKTAPSEALPKSSQPSNLAGLSDCSLYQRQIYCPGDTFQLVDNLPNRKLSPKAFTQENQLQFPAWNSASGISEHQYLADNYRLYLDKMMFIGLGAATMSFTRFYHNYFDLKEQGIDFSRRYANLYAFLKEDKQRLRTPAQLIDELPRNLNQCEKLDRQLIACDNGSHNWLYVAD